MKVPVTGQDSAVTVTDQDSVAMETDPDTAAATGTEDQETILAGNHGLPTANSTNHGATNAMMKEDREEKAPKVKQDQKVKQDRKAAKKEDRQEEKADSSQDARALAKVTEETVTDQDTTVTPHLATDLQGVKAADSLADVKAEKENRSLAHVMVAVVHVEVMADQENTVATDLLTTENQDRQETKDILSIMAGRFNLAG